MSTARIEMNFQGVDLAVYYDRDEGYIEDAEIIIDGGETEWFFESLTEYKREELEEEFNSHMKQEREAIELENQIAYREAS